LTLSGQVATKRQKTNSLQCDPKLRLINWGPFFNHLVQNPENETMLSSTNPKKQKSKFRNLDQSNSIVFHEARFNHSLLKMQLKTRQMIETVAKKVPFSIYTRRAHLA